MMGVPHSSHGVFRQGVTTSVRRRLNSGIVSRHATSYAKAMKAVVQECDGFGLTMSEKEIMLLQR